MKCDVLVVGAGFAGMVMAERLSTELGKKCIVVERRDHLGGNAYDYRDSAGVLIHKYGPHIFHTNSDRVFSYLSRFTKWQKVKFGAKSFAQGRYWSFPINLSTFEEQIGRESTPEEMEKYLQSVRVPIEHPANFEESIVSRVGWEWYNRFYHGYAAKQWNMDPTELDASVATRIPIYTHRSEAYFPDKYEVLPLRGYEAMFRRMLNSNVEVLLGTEFKSVAVEFDHLVYTGPVDEFFEYKYGQLPYRSLRFEMETYWEHLHQPACMIAYPNGEPYTRTVEMKHVTQQCVDFTTVVKEYPQDYGVGKEAFYPVPSREAAAAYNKYKEMADALPAVSFVGRLATYRYYNMDQVVGSALAEFERLRRTRWTSVR